MPLLDQLEEDIRSVSTDLTNLLGHRLMYKDLLEVVQRNPKLQRPSYFYSWLQHQYTTYACLNVRCLIDGDQRTVSLRNILTTLQQNAGLVTADRHANFYRKAGHDPQMGYDEFAQFADASGQALDPTIVAADLQALRDQATAIKTFVDQRLAHRDRFAQAALPNYAELDATIDFLEEISRKYRLILLCIGGDLTPTIVDDWQTLFTIPWIPPESE
jgi:hypothetical protein